MQAKKQDGKKYIFPPEVRAVLAKVRRDQRARAKKKPEQTNVE
jgi:hypothetical protein